MGKKYVDRFTPKFVFKRENKAKQIIRRDWVDESYFQPSVHVLEGLLKVFVNGDILPSGKMNKNFSFIL